LSAGVNIAGFDIGCLADGSHNISKVYSPVQVLG
jgi:endoglucanase